MGALQRVALVTGGSRRVGLAIVQLLRDRGFDVCAASHRDDPDFRVLRADLTDLESTRTLVKSFRAQYSRLDVLVNNASIYEPDDSSNPSAQLGRLMNIHVESPRLLVQEFEPLLRESHGHVVNMLDLLVEFPQAGYGNYCASKAALWSLTRSWARTLAPDVTVNGIAPGVVEWPDGCPEDQREKYLKRVPLARAGSPQDAAALVHFLVTEGTYITGQVIRLDGGRSVT